MECIFATYGGADVTTEVKQRFGGGVNIGPGTYASTFQCKDPFYGERKDFAVVAVDRTANPPECKVTVAEDNQPCFVPAGPHQNTPRPALPARRVIQANYGGRDVTAQCDFILQSKGALDVVPQEAFGDPLPGVRKVLVVVYESNEPDPKHRAVTFWTEGQPVHLARG